MPADGSPPNYRSPPPHPPTYTAPLPPAVMSAPTDPSDTPDGVAWLASAVVAEFRSQFRPE
eukprot:CAMPEP_0194286128 /NCGR_PEP_ID=MMETSP0169-20130528/31910_1 /TAXON_ID=218684 /ORGANISM="Corethron pennatum, Strain L29A3" /LENGTH=60 /DNA_ID=CAMNT_0039032469 /DNA_START=12 /DNA_END=191 /DNA_ORIENTATION=+